jgi:DNA-directed RNA polymerase specialized sigma subunit
MKLEEALKDENLIKIANKAGQQFSNKLSQDEIKNCILGALWSASNNFKENKKTKFSTYLYRGVFYECLKQLKKNDKCQALTNREFINQTIPQKPIENIELMDEIKRCEDPDLIIEKFFYNATLKDMAEKRGVSKETVRFKLKKNINFLKSRLV